MPCFARKVFESTRRAEHQNILLAGDRHFCVIARFKSSRLSIRGNAHVLRKDHISSLTKCVQAYGQGCCGTRRSPCHRHQTTSDNSHGLTPLLSREFQQTQRQRRRKGRACSSPGLPLALCLRIGGYEVFDHSYDAVVIGAGGAGAVYSPVLFSSERAWQLPANRNQCRGADWPQ